MIVGRVGRKGTAKDSIFIPNAIFILGATFLVACKVASILYNMVAVPEIKPELGITPGQTSIRHVLALDDHFRSRMNIPYQTKHHQQKWIDFGLGS